MTPPGSGLPGGAGPKESWEMGKSGPAWGPGAARPGKPAVCY